MSYKTHLIGDVVVNRVRIINTQRDVYSAWEMTTAGEHHVITTIGEDECLSSHTYYGRIDTTNVPDELKDLPRGTIRLRAVTVWQRSQHLRALAYIYAAFPEVLDLMYTLDGGQIIAEGEHF